MVDETTDVSNKEQVVICLRWVDTRLEAHEDFIGLYHVESIEANKLVAVIRDVLRRLDIPYMKIRGQCYDGAVNMSGSIGGVSTQILKEESRAFIVMVTL